MLRVVLTGGPGSGKTSVLEVLAARGYSVRPDAARSIIRERKSAGLSPRPAPIQFARQILDREIASFEMRGTSPVFYERGVADAAGFLLASEGIGWPEAKQLVARYRYDRAVLFPPWEEIYVVDEERDHTFEHAMHVYESTKRWYSTHYPSHVEVPLATPQLRAEYILEIANSN